MKFELFHPMPEDMVSLDYKECYSLGELGCSKTLIEMSHLGRSKESLCLAFANQGLIYGIAGSYRSWAGSAQAWAIFSPAVDKYPVALKKVCTSLINHAVKEQHLVRLSLTVRSDYEKGNNFAKCLGFELEGHMKKYLPDGRDAHLYARIF